ncbi:MAG: radical SAM protein [Candidatus Roizmanbacteria bacterium]|nr:radical SAM protein [Candidatus Roizmanbacteria bacterium]
MPDIAIWNQCNNHCLMCTNPFAFQLEENGAFYLFENLKKVWANHKFKSNDPLSLTGGEPTIHPDFFKLIDWFHGQYPENKIVIASNGRMFYYKNFTKNLFKINNLDLEIAVHGYDEKTHDFITRTKGSFKQTIEGIHNILRFKNDSQELEIRIIITKFTYKNLDKILAFIKNEFDIKQIRNIVLIFIEMEGQAKDNLNIVGITYKEAMKYLPKVVTKWSSLFRDLRLYHFPLCVLPPGLWRYSWRTLRDDEIMFLPRCNKCSFKKYCLGIHRDYLTLIGDKEFKPPKKIKIETNDSFYKPIDNVLK